MTTPKKIAAALQQAKAACLKHQANIVLSTDISRRDRELLVETHWLQEIIKGWYMLTRPDINPGDSAAWYTNFWDFLRVYLGKKYDQNYCLSAETSLELQIGNTLIPKQVIVIVSKGGTLQALPFETSILTYSDAKTLPEEKIPYNHLQIMTLPYALCKITPTYFRDHPDNIQIALQLIPTTAELSQIIAKYGFTRAAERILGAYQILAMQEQFETMQKELVAIGIKVNPTNPFIQAPLLLQSTRSRSPYATRVKLLWQKYRDYIESSAPKSPGLPKEPKQYLSQVDEIYRYDAYNSLSIEGYEVSEELIEKVKSNRWNPDFYPEDTQQRNALAARGYYEAFNSVKKSVKTILTGVNSGTVIKKDLADWYQKLFSPAVSAGIIPVTSLLGYRSERVFIRNSRHVPPPKEGVIDAMQAFFECLEEENCAAVRAVLGHYLFVYIHPYMDGNGRIARFILNAMLASGGYKWTVIELTRRTEYINALETAHTESNIRLFSDFIWSEWKQA